MAAGTLVLEPAVVPAASPALDGPGEARAQGSLPFARRRWVRAARWLGTVMLAVVFIRTFVGEASLVPTGSMEGTILTGDHIFLNKALYGPELPLVHWRLPRLKQAK